MESPAQLLTVASLHSVIMALLSLYDWVIIDSPPATSYPDVATIAAACGGAILVVEAEKTRQEVVEEAKRVLEMRRASICSVPCSTGGGTTFPGSSTGGCEAMASVEPCSNRTKGSADA